MAHKVIDKNTIFINSKKYTLNGRLMPKSVERFPAKVGIGPDDYSFEQFLSNWIIKDQRGGIGREEMDESVDFDRCWWTNCLCDYEGHMFLPRLATEISAPSFTPSAPTIVNDDFETDVSPTAGFGWSEGAGTWTRSAADKHGGTYSWLNALGTAADNLYQDVTGYVPGVEYTYTLWIKGSWADKTWKISINDGVGSTDSSTGTANGVWTQFTVTRTLDIAATQCRLLLTCVATGTGGARATYCDDAVISVTSVTPGTFLKFVNYNSELYGIWDGGVIAKMPAARDDFDIVVDLAATITQVLVSIDNKMYIFCGDNDKSYYMDTDESFTKLAADLDGMTADASTDTDTVVDAGLNGLSICKGDYLYNTTESGGAYITSWDDGTDTVELDSAITGQNVGDGFEIYRGATWAIQWDEKLFRFNANGNGSYSTNPQDASPTWTALTASLADVKSEIERFFIGKDADGNDVISCATNSWYYTLDFTNDKWIRTAVKLPNHPNGGKGACYWHDGHYLSYGLGVKRYVTGSTATVSEVGLIKDDGLPVEYNGEIVMMSGDSGLDVMFSLIDASQTSGNSKSGLYAYTGRAWRCWWIDADNNGAMHDVIVSSAESAYAVYWDCGGSIFYIDIHRGIANAQQLAGTQKYQAAGIHLSPWFDAGTAAFKKLLKRLRTYVANVNTTETIAIKYRMDKANTDLDTGWTTLETLNTTGESGENEEVLASGAGVNFHTYQIRLDLARVGTNTNSPDMQSLVSAYRKLTTDNKQWIIPIIIDGRHGRTKRQQQADLETARASEVDIPILYREDATNETKYVKIFLPQSWTETGQHWQGEYVITALET